MIETSRIALGRSTAVSLAGFLAGLLILQLPGAAAGSGNGEPDANALRWEGEAWRLAQGKPAQTNVDAQLRELIQQADGLRAKGAYGEAALLWRQILVIVEKALGQEHPGTATSLNNLAFLYQAQGRFGEAEPLFKRSLAISEKALGPEHPNTATSLNNLAELYRAQGRFGEAEPLLKRSLAILEKALGPEHPDTANSLNSQGSLKVRQNSIPAWALASLEAPKGP